MKSIRLFSIALCFVGISAQAETGRISSPTTMPLTILIRQANTLEIKNPADLPHPENRMSFPFLLASTLGTYEADAKTGVFQKTRVISSCDAPAAGSTVQVCRVMVSLDLHRWNPKTREEEKLPFDEASEGTVTTFQFQVKPYKDAQGYINYKVLGNQVRVMIAG